MAAIQTWANKVNTNVIALSGNTALTPVGAVVDYAGSTAPTGWLLCNGAAVSRATYASLFSVLGTTYGVGDGSTTFNVPDCRGRFVLGKAASGTGSTLGATGGSLDHTHSGGSVSGSVAAGGDHSHGGSTGSESSHMHGVNITSATGATGNLLYTAGGASVSLPLNTHTHDVSGTTGAGSSHDHTISASGTHQHTAGTLAVGTSGTANPAFVVTNKIIFASV